MEPTVDGQSSVTQPTNTVDTAPVPPPTEKPYDPNKSQAINLQEINPDLREAKPTEKSVAPTVSTEAVAVQSIPNIPAQAEQVQFLKPAELTPSAPVTSVDTQVSASTTPKVENNSLFGRIKSFFGR